MSLSDCRTIGPNGISLRVWPFVHNTSNIQLVLSHSHVERLRHFITTVVVGVCISLLMPTREMFPCIPL